ncbi:hypothetical protein N7449_003717 [Penicillium cf. viridicatum]|uniref:Uncharacterized protein n=1 Tax=Penicillium cf. viridicatum TaxID=2972119 RepID=A0A9W9MXG4_9EURO|nr:hypothetical protein N7449_011112 [Penicillium cf. viridicatum]KAJ5192223.1 hypothetical protein N7449_008365 [Penicillium cf. viridicatum]KAJ5197581.1 hypothetical protein N7449_008060 [Penicillium cf. viridicatum]KAJ5209338.1 hypothetical protein N7449_003717 [Penicillium cf. viridicatum]
MGRNGAFRAKARKQLPPTKRTKRTAPAPEAEDMAHAPDETLPQAATVPTQQVEETQEEGLENEIPTQEAVEESQRMDEIPTEEEVEEIPRMDWIPTQEGVEEVPREDLESDNAPEEVGQGDQQMEDAPQVQQHDSPYLFRRPRRYAMDSQ